MNPVRAFVPPLLVKTIRIYHFPDLISDMVHLYFVRYFINRIIPVNISNRKHFRLIAPALVCRSGTALCVFWNF